MGNNKNLRIFFDCHYCGIKSSDKPSQYQKKRKHYCSMFCYSMDRKENWAKEDQPTWRGGVSNTEAHRRWKKKNPARMAFLKARRYARERGAIGSHTFEEWVSLKDRFKNRCANCFKKKPLTKDHIKPLSKGGSDFINNIQPLCRNCNSKKFNIYENPGLLPCPKMS